MRIENYQFPKSSFLSIEKDLNLITSIMLKNNRLKKLLHYTTPDCLNRPNLTEEESVALFGKNIKIIPKIEIEPDAKNYVLVMFDSFVPNATNPEFRDNLIIFDIFCHQDQWQLKDFELRPYKIAAEIDTMFNKKHLTGIGDLEFCGAAFESFDEDYAGLTLCYKAIHGGEDKYKMPNPADEEAYIEDFNELFNEE